MSYIVILIFAFIQGFTEFLPISSQGHVIFFGNFINFSEIPIREVNILVHSGSLIAVITYHIKSLFHLALSVKNLFRPDIDPRTKLLSNLFFSTIPLVIIGYFSARFISENLLESLLIIGVNSIFFGFLLYFVDVNCLRIKELNQLTTKSSIYIGLFQSLAIFPGSSRSGMVMTGMRLFGYNRKDCVIFSNLLSIPAILGALIFLVLDTDYHSNSLLLFEKSLLLIFSFIFSIIFIHFIINWVKKSSLSIFVAYRLLFGIFLIGFAYNIIQF